MNLNVAVFLLDRDPKLTIQICPRSKPGTEKIHIRFGPYFDGLF
jgi:hypothetical protein